MRLSRTAASASAPPARGKDAARAAERYSWDACAEAYLRLCEAVTRQPA